MRTNIIWHVLVFHIVNFVNYYDNKYQYYIKYTDFRRIKVMKLLDLGFKAIIKLNTIYVIKMYYTISILKLTVYIYK